jgi:hypothetical protein
MADVKDGLEFFEGGVGMRFDVRLKFLRIKRAPFAPAGFWGERAVFGGGQIAVDRAPPQVKTPRGFNLGTASLKKFDHSFPQIQRIGFHAPTLSPYVPMSMLIDILQGVKRILAGRGAWVFDWLAQCWMWVSVWFFVAEVIAGI